MTYDIRMTERKEHMDINQKLTEELGVKQWQIDAAVNLIDEGNTIPFISRYRKEVTGSLNDEQLRKLYERLTYLRNLEEKKAQVISGIEEQGKLTEELRSQILAAETQVAVEDLYRPYRPKRRTRATIAREKGLAPLAELLYAQAPDCPAPEEAAKDYVDPGKGVNSVEEALAGASDIIAETISDDADVRKALRELYTEWADVVSVAAKKDPEDTVYRNYYAFTAPVNKIQGHQVLAVNRGEKEEVLKVSIVINRDAALGGVYRRVLKKKCASTSFVEAAAADAYDRLIAPSMEREIRTTLTDAASEGAIGQFALNLKPLLMQPPVKGIVTMGLDPGYRMC